MKKIMTIMCLGLMVLIFFQPVQATTLNLEKYAFNVNASTFPDDFDHSSFNTGTGLGTITWTTSVQASYNIGAFFDIEIDRSSNTFYNEYGSKTGNKPGQLSWEIDEPGYSTSSSSGDIYSNFTAGNLDNTNTNGVPSTAPDDVSFALAWQFDLAADHKATISWVLTESQNNLPGFYLMQTDPDSSENIYFYTSLDIVDTGGGGGGGSNPVPEPATLFLFGLGMLGFAGLGRKKTR